MGSGPASGLRPILMTAIRVHPRRRAADDSERGRRGQPEQSIGTNRFSAGMLAATIPDPAVRARVLRPSSKNLRERGQSHENPNVSEPHQIAGRVENQEISHESLESLARWAPPSFCIGAAIAAYSVHSGPVAAAAPGGPARHAGPRRGPSSSERFPVYLEYSARTESIREVSLQAKVAGYNPVAAGGRRRRREGRRAPLQDR